MPKIPFWIFILLAILHISSVRVGVMDIDASQYAEISREMLENGNYLHLYDRGTDYLDKPPFLFWISVIGMKIFGVGNLGYKLPSILFALWAIYATYRLARVLYGDAIARMAALILGTCQGMFLMTNDIRTDTVLMSWTVTALWMLKEWDTGRRLPWLLGGSAAIALGMMSKGPIALLVPAFCFGSHWLLKKQWRRFADPQFLIGIIVIALLLVPMSIGLYQQFDVHPEKTVNGLKGVSGLKFFYWSQSFGRITGESPWNNGAGIDFLFVNMLWSFLPWILLFVPALVWKIVSLFSNQPGRGRQEWITLGGFLLSYLALGSSKYQLPHYIFVVFPLAAIMTAAFLAEVFDGKFPRLLNILRPVQWFISFALIAAAFLIIFYVFPASPVWYIYWFIAVFILFFIALKQRLQPKMFWLSVAGIMLSDFFMTNHFYYRLQNFQMGNQVATYIHQHNIPPGNIIQYKPKDPLNSLHFYAQAVISKDSFAITPGNYVLTQDSGLQRLEKKGIAFQMVHRGKCFRVSELKKEFLNPKTRDEAMMNYYLLKIRTAE